MKKAKNDLRNKKPQTMLGEEVGSMQDRKSNEDFNNEHPDHDEAGSMKVNKKIKT
jgi:hypothetical protein